MPSTKTNEGYGNQHSGVLQFFTMISQHVFGQHHAGRPKLASASRREILVELDGVGEKTREV